LSPYTFNISPLFGAKRGQGLLLVNRKCDLKGQTVFKKVLEPIKPKTKNAFVSAVLSVNEVPFILSMSQVNIQKKTVSYS